MRKFIRLLEKEVVYPTGTVPPAPGLEQKRGGMFALYTPREMRLVKDFPGTARPQKASLLTLLTLRATHAQYSSK
jgi:hypothetical protein